MNRRAAAGCVLAAAAVLLADRPAAAFGKLKRWGECKSALERALALDLGAASRQDAQTQLANCTEQSEK